MWSTDVPARPRQRHRLPRQRGFSLITAIFLVVVLGTIGAFMTTLSVVQHSTSSMSLQGMRAWYAARVGTQWALQQLLEANRSCSDIDGATVVAQDSTGSPVLTGFDIVVQDCLERGPFRERASEVVTYTVTVSASVGSIVGSDLATRRIRTTVRDES